MSASASTAANSTGKRGAFIVFEGLDRSGKTTQLQKLVDRLQQDGVDAAACRFPDRTTSTGKMIDSYLASKSDLDDRAVHLLFSVNRWERAKGILDNLEQGKTIVCDRYAFSGIAFSAVKGLSYEWCLSPDVGLPAPDLVLFFNVSAKVQKQRGGFGQERYETTEIQKNVRAMFEKIGKDVGHSWEVVEGDRGLEEIGEEVLERARRVIKGELGPVRELWKDRSGKA
ncbi:BZ3500_MvSof-1268-A1-R1_Chr4-1g06809 [Microbotryum saponariae]|uniref:Thymidylate kinase n=1 Tax=Microbotryum saponariae TaxID=289078 RepID=A0A2X0KY61_9BASI|nr:BZ3500_MvSof-1268-A1-R1_Chr4-1g06809 [Microbotryum saponariae]SDA06466.1 BZ3501_MvSof-1269-A2-R1_Chr4-1g06511 [Microbotryum saponariae]